MDTGIPCRLENKTGFLNRPGDYQSIPPFDPGDVTRRWSINAHKCGVYRYIAAMARNDPPEIVESFGGQR
jgi:hypothetical protein